LSYTSQIEHSIIVTSLKKASSFDHKKKAAHI